jgi:GNAT superfamily N-acetyltransferase
MGRTIATAIPPTPTWSPAGSAVGCHVAPRDHRTGGATAAGPGGRIIDEHRWVEDIADIDWDELSALYRIAPLGEKPPDALRTVFSNSMFVRFVYAEDRLVGAGRAIADGLDCAYIADVAVHPDRQGKGLGQALIRSLLEAASGHRKVILYANPGTEGFYRRLGFLPMNTAMGVWADPDGAVRSGILRAD